MANSMKIGFTLSNFGEFAKLLEDLPASVESRVMGTAVDQAMKPIVNLAKAKAKVRSGALRKSITSVVRRYPDKGKIVGIIGPEKGARYLGGRKIVRGGSLLKTDRPDKYAHLVEFGHHTAAATGANVRNTKGRTIREGTLTPKAWVVAQPFLRPAVAQGEVAAVGALADGVTKGLERETKYQLSKLKRIKKAA